MDTVMLSRLQFAVATLFHFIFVPLSIGLPVLIGIFETRYVISKDELYKRHARFWGRLLIINFVIGVVTGLTLEFQFGTNWSRFSKYVGDVFGPLLAIETTTAFFLESTFIAVWAFGWNRVSPKVHSASIWLVALAAWLSGFWILAANAWMNHPVGYAIRNGRAELTDFWALIANPFGIQQVLHVLGASMLISAFFMLGVSAYHILLRRDVDFFLPTYRLGANFALVFAVFVGVQGHLHGGEVARTQPAKLAAMEPTWQTQRHAPIYLFAIPDEKLEKNRYVFGAVPSALSLMAYHQADAEVRGLKSFPSKDRPPVLITAVAFRLMVMLGVLFFVIGLLAWYFRRNPQNHRWVLWATFLTIPLPFLAAELGWIVTEVGRQPWIVYNVMRTQHSASSLPVGHVMVSLITFIVVYTLLGLIAVYLMAREAGRVAADEEKGY